jgi:hypothetical protein
MEREGTIVTDSPMYSNTTERRSWPSIAGRSHWISWGAVFAGVVVGTAVQATLGLLGIGVGASTVDPNQEANPLAGLGLGAAIWMFASTIISYYASGWFAGRSAGIVSRGNGALHGFVTWGASTVATLFVISGLIGGAAAGATRLLGSTAQLANSFGVPASVENLNIPTPPAPEPIVEDAATTDAPAVPGDQSEVAMNPEQPQQVSPQQMREIGDNAAEGTAKTGYFGFALLLLSAIAAGLGGAVSSTPRYSEKRASI